MILVNDQNLDMFGDLESFKDSIPEINKVIINGHEYEYYSSHKKLWNFYNSWNTYDIYEQNILWHYAKAFGLSILEVDSMAEEAFDSFFEIYSTNAEAGENLLKLYIGEKAYNFINHLLDGEILGLIANNNLMKDEDYYFYI